MILVSGPGIMFLGQSSIGEGCCEIAPQLKSFDVYYDEPLTVGFQVIGEDSEGCCKPSSVVGDTECGC